MANSASATPAAVHLDQIAQVAITVDDLARARNFYQNTLGLKFLFDAGTMCFFQCGSTRIMIATAEKPAPRGGTILYYKVKDLEATYAALQEKGAVFLQPPQGRTDCHRRLLEERFHGISFIRSTCVSITPT